MYMLRIGETAVDSLNAASSIYTQNVWHFELHSRNSGSGAVSSKTLHCLKYGFIAAAMNVCLKARDSQANR